jgi:membrane protease YdiL (CAAX protease family)
MEGRTMKKGLIWFVGTLLVYAAIMYLMGSYNIPSFIYHTLLLVFPLGLILLNRANIQLLGLVRGKYRPGLSLAVGLIALSLAIFWWRYGLALPTLNAVLASTVIYAPITEELFFRGYLQPGLESRYGKWVGLVITATLFTIIHLPKVLLTPLAAPIDLLTFFIMGMAFGFIRDTSESVYYPMLCHIGYNFAVSAILY